MVYVDVFVAGVGKWYEFKCEETALIRDIIKEIYDVIRDKESIICEKQIDLEPVSYTHLTLPTTPYV